MRKSMFMLILFGLVLAFAACKKEEARLAYPETKKVDQVDDYFGTKVADPYRWLEDDNAEDTKAWVEAQNKVTFGYLDTIPYRPAIKARLTEIFNYPRYSSPFRVGENYFFYKNDGLQNQSVCYIQKGLDGAPEVFFDPNALSPDGTIRVGIIGPSSNDKYLAISRGEAGSDWSEIRVMEIATKQELPDRVQWVKFSGAAWHGDGFYYSGYDKPAAGRGAQGQERVPEGLLPQARRPAGEGRRSSGRTRSTPCATSAPARPRTRSGSSSPSRKARAAPRSGSRTWPRRTRRSRCSSRASSSTPRPWRSSTASSSSTPTPTPRTSGSWPSTRPTRPRRTGRRSSPRSPRS